MFRNSYLDTYKHSVMYNKEVQFLFVHLSQIYTTLGSVINDIEYQFGLILAQTAISADKNHRNSTKSSFGAKNQDCQNYQNNQFVQMQNKLQNFVHVQRKKITQVRMDQKPTIEQKKIIIQKNQIFQNVHQIVEQAQKRQSSGLNVPIVESTQDFDDLFFPKREQIINQNSNSHQVFKQQIKQNVNSSINKVNKSNANKKSADDNNDFMDKLFRN